MEDKINFALALNKPHKDNPKGWELLEGKEVKKLSDRFFIKPNGNIEKKELHQDKFKFEGINFDKIEENQLNSVKSLTSSYDYIDFKPDWCFIVGLGTSSVYNTGITLHHIYGTPYIPASSIKGSVRSWKILEEEFQKENENSEGLAIENEEFCKVFGCPKNLDLTKDGFREYKSALKFEGKNFEFEGNIMFFDAFPLSTPKIKVDIMTPHYHDYYGDNDGKTPPADYFSPNPISFLTVEETTFRMYFGVKKEPNEKLVETTKKWVDNALFHRGIGAKTAIGYGYNENTNIEENKTIFEVKIEPEFLSENRNSLNPKKSYSAEGIITKAQNGTHYASIYIEENDIRHDVKINGLRSNVSIEVDTVIKVKNIKVDKKGKFKEATFEGYKINK